MPDSRTLRSLLVPAPQDIGAFALTLAALLIPAAPSTAQEPSSDQSAPAHLSVVDGDVVLDREVDSDSAQAGMPIVAGDRLRSRRGRVDVVFPDGTALDLDEFTEVDVQSPVLVRLTSGRLRLTVPRDSPTIYQIDTPAATVWTDGPGEFRVGVLGSGAAGETELAVARGRAELVGDRGSVRVQAGERSLASAGDLPSRPVAFNSARSDAFDVWASAQRDDRATGRSAQYLPPDLRVYGGTLDRYGTWEYDSGYGYVWFPSVEMGWRPYYDGYWSTVPSVGWTWIGKERWSWPTHHYGRWGYSRSRWFWIPEHRWAPAWVSWGAAPGYVSWCPLGFDNRPVFELSVSLGRGWDGWTVLPRERFGARRDRVERYAVAPRGISPRTPFIVQSTPPVASAHTAMRSIAGNGPRRAAASPRSRDRDRGDRADRFATTRRAPPPPTPPLSAATAARVTRPEPRTQAEPRRYPFGDFRRPGADEATAAQNDAAPPATPRRAPPQPPPPRSGATAPRVTTPEPRTQAEPRRYPFGDFRRPSADEPTLAPNAPSQPATPRALPRARALDQGGRSSDEQSGRSRRPGDRDQRDADGPAQVQGSAPIPAGRSRGDNAGTSGAIVRGPRAERGDPGGGAIGGALRQDSNGGTSTPGRAASGGQEQPRADGRAHAPESRRPHR